MGEGKDEVAMEREGMGLDVDSGPDSKEEDTRGELVGTGNWVGPVWVVSELTGGEELEDADEKTAGDELAAGASDDCADCALLSTGVEVEDAMNPVVAATKDVLAPVGLASVDEGLGTVSSDIDGWMLDNSPDS